MILFYEKILLLTLTEITIENLKIIRNCFSREIII